MEHAQTTLRYAAAALFTVASGVGLAQGQTQPTPGAQAPAATTQQQAPQMTYLASRLDGAAVYSLTGSEKIADLQDIVVSERGQVVALILSQGAGAGARHVAVNPAYFRFRPVSPNEVRVETNLTADQIRSVAQFDYPARRR